MAYTKVVGRSGGAVGGRTPAASSGAALSRMKAQRQRDTKPEIALRKALHRLGLRYRVDRRVLPGVPSRADVVFTRAMVAVFVDGCFWHGCPLHATWPASNAEWWRAKIKANRMRDRAIDDRLTAAGWCVVRSWAHEPSDDVAQRVAALVRERTGGDVKR